MMMTKGMTRQEVEQMVEAMGWEMFDAMEEDGCFSCTVWQEDHAVAVECDEDERVASLEYIPAWAL